MRTIKIIFILSSLLFLASCSYNDSGRNENVDKVSFKVSPAAITDSTSVGVHNEDKAIKNNGIPVHATTIKIRDSSGIAPGN